MTRKTITRSRTWSIPSINLPVFRFVFSVLPSLSQHYPFLLPILALLHALHRHFPTFSHHRNQKKTSFQKPKNPPLSPPQTNTPPPPRHNSSYARMFSRKRAYHFMACNCNDPGRPRSHFSSIFLSTLLVVFSAAAGSPESDAAVLLRLKQSLGNSERLGSWAQGTMPCNGTASNWRGVRCYKERVWGLQLEGMELKGAVDVDALAALPSLRTISFMRNRLDGPIPPVGRLAGLKSVYLSDNQFSGEIPADAFLGMKWLKKVHLARNAFEGWLPPSLTRLPRLLVLRAEENRFIGEIPAFKLPNLRLVNVSYNQLEGSIPLALSEMDNSSFLGNKDLCGKPLDIICKPTFKKSSTTLLLVLIVLAIVVALAIIGLIIILLRQQSRASQSDKIPSTNQNKVAAYQGDQLERSSQGSVPSSQKKSGKDHNQGKLIFLLDREKFELRDLLRSSAEVLGSGSFGSSYKAVLYNGPLMVVKRFREMNGVGREDFQEHMRRLGRLRHPNLLPMVAYYYRKDEKLLVTDFVSNGSLVQLLHGNRSPNRPTLDWPMRLKIVKGVARGLSYLYDELHILTIPHGHIKSSNVLLNDSFEPILTDYALAPVMNKDHARQLMVAYKSPEYMQHGQVTKKSDVWSLGILILEIMTGQFPANYLAQGKGSVDLVAWVNSIARAEWTDEVFDNEMVGPKNGEMWKLLKIGLNCCEEDVERRWELKVAVERIEELRVKEANASYASEEEMFSSRDEFSFS